MTANSYRILIGANGWLHPTWQGIFYPDDLPDDWRLGYYSNEFPLALMPATYWQYDDEEIQSWLEDSTDSLRLICEIPTEYLQLPVDEAVDAINRFIQRLAVTGEHCLGLLLSLSNQPPEPEAIIKRLDRTWPLCVDIKADMSDAYAKLIQKICHQSQVGICWHGQGPAIGLGFGPLAMTRLAGQGMTLRQLRTVVEAILQESRAEQTSILIFDGNPPDLEAMRQTGVILDLI